VKPRAGTGIRAGQEQDAADDRTRGRDRRAAARAPRPPGGD